MLLSGGWTPTVHLYAQARGKLRYDGARAALVPSTQVDGVAVAGAANGAFTLDEALRQGHAGGGGQGAAPNAPAGLYRITADWPKPDAPGRRWIDFQSDVTLKDIALASREGYVSVEHLKRYTTLGMRCSSPRPFLIVFALIHHLAEGLAGVCRERLQALSKHAKSREEIATECLAMLRRPIPDSKGRRGGAYLWSEHRDTLGRIVLPDAWRMVLATDGKSLGLSLRNIYETLAISFPTVVDALRGRVTKVMCDERLDRWSRNIVRNAGIQLEVEGRSNIRDGETYLVMSDHQSHYDIPVLFQVIGPNIRMIAKEELFRVPVFGKALAAGGFISIDRRNRNAAMKSLQRARDLLASGTHVWVAPEGTRSRTGELLPFKKGAFYLALQARLPILPVTIQGTRDALPAKGLRSTAGAQVRVTLHPHLDTRAYAEQGKSGREALMTEVRRVLESVL